MPETTAVTVTTGTPGATGTPGPTPTEPAPIVSTTTTIPFTYELPPYLTASTGIIKPSNTVPVSIPSEYPRIIKFSDNSGPAGTQYIQFILSPYLYSDLFSNNQQQARLFKDYIPQDISAKTGIPKEFFVPLSIVPADNNIEASLSVQVAVVPNVASSEYKNPSAVIKSLASKLITNNDLFKDGTYVMRLLDVKQFLNNGYKYIADPTLPPPKDAPISAGPKNFSPLEPPQTAKNGSIASDPKTISNMSFAMGSGILYALGLGFFLFKRQQMNPSSVDMRQHQL
jgi:hypothetical protein